MTKLFVASEAFVYAPWLVQPSQSNQGNHEQYVFVSFGVNHFGFQAFDVDDTSVSAGSICESKCKKFLSVVLNLMM